VTANLWEGSSATEWQAQLGLPAVHLFDTVGSTNDVARDLANRGAPALTLVIADHQTSGRGRAGRSWLSTPGSSVLCSVVFRPREAAASAPGAAPVRVGHAVAEAIADVARVDARVKWPNDVVIPGFGKVAGVLCEAATRQGSTFVIAGIGINVRAPGGAYVSLDSASGMPISRADVLLAVVDALRPQAERITLPLDHDELVRIGQRDLLYNQQVVDDRGLVGTACGIAADGSLLVRTGDDVTAVHNATIRLAGSHDYPGARV
jgi:BirA family transcriptional regulator, biotin operon repressor / biotin---[acetyl-CoA-carboxylase] ligase